MPNLKVQDSNEVQRQNEKKNEEDILLTFEICHLTLMSQVCSYMPETGCG